MFSLSRYIVINRQYGTTFTSSLPKRYNYHIPATQAPLQRWRIPWSWRLLCVCYPFVVLGAFRGAYRRAPRRATVPPVAFGAASGLPDASSSAGESSTSTSDMPPSLTILRTLAPQIILQPTQGTGSSLTTKSGRIWKSRRKTGMMHRQCGA